MDIQIDPQNVRLGDLYGVQDALTLPEVPEPPEALPATTYHFVDLPQTTLHYVRCGEGPPLVMVPATVSEIGNWLPLAQLMGRYFTTYFFELPGHGRSTPFSEPFSSQLVAETVEAFIDQLGYDRVTLLGFSFGGVLTMRTLYHLGDRVERVIFFAPAVTHRALPFRRPLKLALRWWLSLMCSRQVCHIFVRVIKNDHFRNLFTGFIQRIGGVEDGDSLSERLLELQWHTFHTLARQLYEVLCLDPPRREVPFLQPCYFAMSVNDPLLNFETTLAAVRGQFAQVQVKRLAMPYHQNPDPPTYQGLVAEYGQFIEEGVRKVRRRGEACPTPTLP
jgi:pimeloyl-ACP methyl ester carboxylesterase